MYNKYTSQRRSIRRQPEESRTQNNQILSNKEFHYFYKKLYFDKLRNIKMIDSDKTIEWESKPRVLTCCIIEPRVIDTLPGVLYNIANIYGNKGVGLTIYHGNNNINYIKTITCKWKNVEYKSLNVDNLHRNNYSYLLTQKGFYKSFTSSHVLIFQSDSYIFKKIPDYYFQFDYIGAPWVKTKGNGCGNGGISLRNVNKMISVSEINGSEIDEDVYFSNKNINVCNNYENHKAFSTEGVFHPDPACCHQPYFSMTDKSRRQEYMNFLNKII